MHRQIGVVILLLTFTCSLDTVSSQDPECGIFKQEPFLEREPFAVPTEHQWLARIAYENGHKSKLRNHGCLGALISKKNVLAPAHCFLHYEGQEAAFAVHLGVWSKSSSAHQVSCETDGYCVLPVQEIPLAVIAIHPDYDPITLQHSLAVLTMQREAKMTDVVQPICMPPPDLVRESLVGKFFIVAGLSTNKDLKQKSWVNSISLPLCQKISSLVTSSSIFCGYQDQAESFYSGAPLVGLQVRSNTTQNYYLAGLLMDWTKKGDRIVSSFLDVRPYLKFINQNADSPIVRT